MFKKLMFVCGFMFAASVFAADPAFIGWNCSKEVYDAAIAKGDLSEGRKALYQVLNGFNNNECNTYEDLCKKIDSLPNTITKDTKTMWKKQIPLCKPVFLKEAWEFCKANPTPYDLNFVIRDSACKTIGLTDVERYNLCVKYLVDYNKKISAGMAKKVLNKLVDIGSTSSEITTQKADLQKLNRIYTKKLIDDKTTWEPFIALIRTTLETY